MSISTSTDIDSFLSFIEFIKDPAAVIAQLQDLKNVTEQYNKATSDLTEAQTVADFKAQTQAALSIAQDKLDTAIKEFRDTSEQTKFDLEQAALQNSTALTLLHLSQTDLSNAQADFQKQSNAQIEQQKELDEKAANLDKYNQILIAKELALVAKADQLKAVFS